jgi:very-short-patch-repair endonuclease/uncharacterized protein YbbK (DUF523 family)
MGKKLTQEEIIKRFEEVHGDKYDYNKVVYNGINKKVFIVCPEHGKFLQTPNNHLSGYGCSKCAGNLKLKQEEIIKRFKEVHKDKYDYSKVMYENTNKKVIIICPEHGEFLQTPSNHLRNQGCKKCKWNDLKLTQEEVIKRFKKVHGDKYDYSKVRYINSNTKVEILCSEHGSFFQLPSSHLNKHGCPKCAYLHNILNNIIIIKKFKNVHKDYNYSKVNYNGSNTKVEIVCLKHGSFFQIPFNHYRGTGCPKCAQENSESKGERKVREFLEENNIKYSQEVKLFDNYRFDFYLEDLNTVIEYDGKQHFEPVEYFGGLEGFLKTQERDKIKTEYCLENNIRIIRIAYFEEVEEILKPLITGSRELV